MIKIKDKQSIAKMRTAGRKLAEIVESLTSIIKPGLSTAELDSYIEKLMVSAELKAVCKGYGSYKHATCISINDVIVHGVPSEKVIIKEGDLVKVDVVGSFGGYCADMARCFLIGAVPEVASRLSGVARVSLDKAIRLIKPGIHLSDISATIQAEVEAAGFNVVRKFAGHGIGKSLHEEPEIPNFGKKGQGPILRSGMTLAVEPMITEGGYDVVIDSDKWTARTKDGKLAAHVEDTILVTENGAEILTRVK